MNVAQIVSDWLLWIVGSIFSFGALISTKALSAYRRSKDNKERLTEDVEPTANKAHDLASSNRRILSGASDDPTHDGVLEIVEDNNEQICQLEERMEEQHERVLERLEEVTDPE